MAASTPFTVARFERSVRNAESVYRRLDRGELTGRNSDATDATIRGHVETCRALMKAELHDDDSPLFAWLDAHPKLAERWDRIERRYYGLR